MQSDNSNFKIEFQKRLVRFAIDVVKLCNDQLKEKTFWSITDQIIRSASSVGANVTEAKSSSSKREYIKYFEIALKSANETLFWFEVVKELKPSEEVVRLQKECSEVASIIAAGVLKMKDKR